MEALPEGLTEKVALDPSGVVVSCGPISIDAGTPTARGPPRRKKAFVSVAGRVTVFLSAATTTGASTIDHSDPSKSGLFSNTISEALVDQEIVTLVPSR